MQRNKIPERKSYKGLIQRMLSDKCRFANAHLNTKKSKRIIRIKQQPRQESNLDQTFRKRLFYPLNYGAMRHHHRAVYYRVQRYWVCN